ncbi:MAG: entericidin A/B family lipoprotein [Betaproteobacteria bacterium]|nr:entericidin A/B family lipoprotein [Betaproteobacteria bacterium]
MKKLVLVIIALAFGVSGCNTLNGIGKDVEKLGEKAQDASKK